MQPPVSSTTTTDRKLARLVRVMFLVLVVGTVAFAAFYYLDANRGSGPTLMERQVGRAEDAVRDQPDNITARVGLAGLYLAALRYDDAAEQFSQVISVQPENRVALTGWARALYLAGETEAARELFQQVVEISSAAEFANVDPSAQEAHYHLGLIAYADGTYEDAISEFQAALAIESMDADSYYQLGRTYLGMGDAQAALEPLRRTILYVPTEWREPYDTLADAYAELDRPDDAAYAAAMATFVDGDAAGARATLESLVTPDASAELLLGLGFVTEALDDRNAAMSWYARALVADPNSFSAQQGFLRTDGSGAAFPHDDVGSEATSEPDPPVTAQAEG